MIKRCLLKDFSAVLDYLCDIKTTTKAILLCVAQIMEGLFLEKRGVKKVHFNDRPVILGL